MTGPPENNKSSSYIDGEVVRADLPHKTLEEALYNAGLPPGIEQFREERLDRSTGLTDTQWNEQLHATEVRDKQQQIKLRPIFAIGVFVLIIGQNIGVWFIVVWALQRQELPQLQLIFSTLIAGSLTQSYFILRFITNKVFSDIDYHNGDKKSNSSE